jgi:hypothetical protein
MIPFFYSRAAPSHHQTICSPDFCVDNILSGGVTEADRSRASSARRGSSAGKASPSITIGPPSLEMKRYLDMYQRNINEIGVLAPYQYIVPTKRPPPRMLPMSAGIMPSSDLVWRNLKMAVELTFPDIV